MKIRIQNSDKFLDVNVEHPYLLSNLDVFNKEARPQLLEAIHTNNLKCDGCGKLLKNREWICVYHRPMSAKIIKETYRFENKKTGEVYGGGEIELKDTWAFFLFCFDTRTDCIGKWKDKRLK